MENSSPHLVRRALRKYGPAYIYIQESGSSYLYLTKAHIYKITIYMLLDDFALASGCIRVSNVPHFIPPVLGVFLPFCHLPSWTLEMFHPHTWNAQSCVS